MIENENIICISSIDWDFNWQGHQEIMSTLAKSNNRILFIENTGIRMPGIRDAWRIKSRISNWFKGAKGIRKVMDNLYVFSPVILPFPYLRLARIVNRRLISSTLDKWVKATNFNNAIVWTFLPTPLSLDIIDTVSKKLIVYYCIDNLKASSPAAAKVAPYESALLKKADLVFVTSKNLYDYCKQYSKDVHFFPFAVNFRQFEAARLKKDNPVSGFLDLKKPIIGYIGGINAKMDQQLIKKIALVYPEYSFVFVGPIEADVSLIADLKNVSLLGDKKHGDIPYFIKLFDVCLIPYVNNEYTDDIYPAKLNEYHAMGKPVVSTMLPEVASFNRKNNDLVFLSQTFEEFAQNINAALESASNPKQVELRIESAGENSWFNRIEEMSSLIADSIEKKSKKPANSLDTFFSFFRGLRSNIFSLFLGAVCLYLMVFYTPLVWVLAKPLEINQQPKKVEAIVVLAGGVGESGQAGQGYEERVGYAVDLYKKGFAPNMIFSSGFMYVFKEPLVMKALATSLGVPENAILLEDKAKSTYEQALFVRSILKEKKFSKIIIVSAPYHMLRLSLVMRKYASDIEALYLPVPNSVFYQHGVRSDGRKTLKQIELKQIKAILHEYIGIFYYWVKGKI